MESKLEELVSLTGMPANEAENLLKIANGDIQAAASIFFGDASSTPTNSAPQPKPTPAQQPTPSQPNYKPEKSTGGIRGFGDYKTEEDKNKKNQAWFSGGHQSGIQVEAPQSQSNDEFVSNVFEKAKQQGAVSKSDLPLEQKEKFSGSGMTLEGGHVPAAPKKQGPKTVVLTFWKDCFTVDDGQPRYFKDPQNKEFLEDVTKGVVPRELESLGSELNVELVQKNGEDYKPPPKPKLVAFSGSGQTLGGPSTSSSSSSSGSKATACSVVVDSSQPVTTIQIRLHDGSKLVAKFNLTHTVGDIRSHIEANHPTGKSFELRTSFPPAVLSDDKVTIQDAKLANAALIQRLT
eukprot:TRINITY_DN4367_c0_g3_i1.p1 TRINITY_DN4367_c0_g3~~TRINITY_DN4367_c0_g3_i1.p1  ORF type:complete len:348 (+),score=121.32 TRINITY_DN4367_c0_g3_i1:534-1577(+)